MISLKPFTESSPSSSSSVDASLAPSCLDCLYLHFISCLTSHLDDIHDVQSFGESDEGCVIIGRKGGDELLLVKTFASFNGSLVHGQ